MATGGMKGDHCRQVGYDQRESKRCFAVQDNVSGNSQYANPANKRCLGLIFFFTPA